MEEMENFMQKLSPELKMQIKEKVFDDFVFNVYSVKKLSYIKVVDQILL